MAPLGRIPEATVARLPLYLRGLDAFPVGVTATVSSDELADLAGVNAAKVRKDLRVTLRLLRGRVFLISPSASSDQPPLTENELKQFSILVPSSMRQVGTSTTSKDA